MGKREGKLPACKNETRVCVICYFNKPKFDYEMKLVSFKVTV